MRLLVEILIVAGLIYLGWDKPFKQWDAELRAKVPIKQSTASSEEAVAPPATPARGAWMWNPDRPGALDRPVGSGVGTAPAQVTPSASVESRRGAWMWDPNHRSVLDRPAYDQTGPTPAATPPKYRDASGRTYWIDAQGIPHYDQ